MSNDLPFSSSRQDVSNLKQTAVDAAKDLGSTAAVHAQKAKGQLRELATHARSEGSDQFEDLSDRVNDLVDTARDYVKERPLTCLGIALAVGFVLAVGSRRR